VSYVVVEDVPASWEGYEIVAGSIGLGPRGLRLHLAGPTDEGFRIVQVWDSEAAWQRFEPELRAALASIDPVVGPRAAVRDRRVVHEIIGDPWPGAPVPPPIPVGPGAALHRSQKRREGS
jgi:hypothetical protein